MFAGKLTIVAALTILSTSIFAAGDDDKAFGQFQEILQGLDKRSFEQIKNSIDQTDLMNRVYSAQPVNNEAQDILASNFWQMLEATLFWGLPPAGSQVTGNLVDIVFQDGIGRAAVRYALPGYAYKYLVIDLRHDSRGQLKIVDIFDSSTGQMLSADIGEELMIAMPTKEETRRLIATNNPTDLELFQFTEILKASRDKQALRFFEIYDDLSIPLRSEPFVAKQAVRLAILIKDTDRFVQALEVFAGIYSADANFALSLSHFYLMVEDYEQSYAYLVKFHENFTVKEGALPAKLSALALTTDNPEAAENYALEATVDEPSLELGWWSLLRARAGASNYAGALYPLTHLEDDFGNRLDESKLRRDRFRAFGLLAESQEFKDWRAGRD
jgi:hypothetical protein